MVVSVREGVFMQYKLCTDEVKTLVRWSDAQSELPFQLQNHAVLVASPEPDPQDATPDDSTPGTEYWLP
jgi:tartrate dehydratase beta subunit/fumarate hydratase class I family protein